MKVDEPEVLPAALYPAGIFNVWFRGMLVGVLREDRTQFDDGAVWSVLWVRRPTGGWKPGREMAEAPCGRQQPSATAWACVREARA